MFNQSTYHAGDTNTTVNNNTLVPGAIDHLEAGTFFVSFEWGSEVARKLTGPRPTYRHGFNDYPVEIIRMITMLDRVVAELKFVEEKVQKRGCASNPFLL